MKSELLPLVDETGRVIGKALRSECHGQPGLLHPVVHLHVINSAGQLYLQKRSGQKDTFPGRWDTAVGGHVDYGEDVVAALRREASEELGLQNFAAAAVGTQRMDNELESEYTYIYLLEYEGPFELNHEEIDEGRFWSPAEIEELLGKDIFTPNFEQDFRLLQKLNFI